MELSRRNFLKFLVDEKIFVDNVDELAEKNPSVHIREMLNMPVIDIFKKIRERFDMDLVSTLTPWPKNKRLIGWGTVSVAKGYDRVWIENFKMIDVNNIVTILVEAYFAKKGFESDLRLLKFLHDEKKVDDSDRNKFRRISALFVSRNIRFVLPQLHEIHTDFRDLYDDDTNMISIFFDRFFVKDAQFVMNFFNSKLDGLQYEVLNVFGGYFDGMRHYVMLENGKVLDHMSTSRRKFDPVTVMLTAKKLVL